MFLNFKNLLNFLDPDPDGFLDKKEDSNAGSSGYKSLQVKIFPLYFQFVKHKRE